MSTYVISDIHGEYDKFLHLLDIIKLKDEDTLYILGDAIDRGPDPVKVLKFMMQQPNIIPIAGNHDYAAIICLPYFDDDVSDKIISDLDEDTYNNIVKWYTNGGKTTVDSFKKLSRTEKDTFMNYLKSFDLYAEVNTDKYSYVLVHAGFENFDENRPLYDYDINELVWIRMDYNKRYFKDKYLITGHTPTMNITDNPHPGYIYRKNGNIAIDCGACFGGRLSAICLETQEEFYSN